MSRERDELVHGAGYAAFDARIVTAPIWLRRAVWTVLAILPSHVRMVIDAEHFASPIWADIPRSEQP